MYLLYHETMFDISIHAAREGGDATHRTFSAPSSLFQSTPPVKAATARNTKACCKGLISIHAAREGGDCHQQPQCGAQSNFNPRRP